MQLIQPMFAMHGVGIILTGVIIQKKMTCQHFFLMDAPVYTLHIIPLNGDC